MGTSSRNSDGGTPSTSTAEIEDEVKNGVFAMEVCIDDIDKVALFYLDEVFPITMNRDQLIDVFHKLPQLKFQLCTEKPERALPERLVFRSHVSVGNIASFIQSGLMQPNNFSRHFDGAHYLDYRDQTLPPIGELLRRADCEQYDPYGALFFAFKCRGQYESDVWIDGTEPKDGQKPWPRAYHGTSYQNIQKILEVSDGQLVPGIRNAYGKGVYMSPDPQVAQSYAHPYNYRGKCYKAALMVYPNPDKLERNNWRGSSGAYWVVKDYQQSIRLAGLCIWLIGDATEKDDNSYSGLQKQYDREIGEVKVANGLTPHKASVPLSAGPVLEKAKGTIITVSLSRSAVASDEEPLLPKPSAMDPIEVQIAYMAQCERLAAAAKEKSKLEEEIVFEDHYPMDSDEEDGEEEVVEISDDDDDDDDDEVEGRKSIEVIDLTTTSSDDSEALSVPEASSISETSELVTTPKKSRRMSETDNAQ